MSVAINSLAKKINNETQDAFSHDSFAAGEWQKAIVKLLELGFSEIEVKAIMYSKWTRHCRTNGEGTAFQLLKFIGPIDSKVKADVAELVQQTFGA